MVPLSSSSLSCRDGPAIAIIAVLPSCSWHRNPDVIMFTPHVVIIIIVGSDVYPGAVASSSSSSSTPPSVLTSILPPSLRRRPDVILSSSSSTPPLVLTSILAPSLRRRPLHHWFWRLSWRRCFVVVIAVHSTICSAVYPGAVASSSYIPSLVLTSILAPLLRRRPLHHWFWRLSWRRFFVVVHSTIGSDVYRGAIVSSSSSSFTPPSALMSMLAPSFHCSPDAILSSFVVHSNIGSVWSWRRLLSSNASMIYCIIASDRDK